MRSSYVGMASGGFSAIYTMSANGRRRVRAMVRQNFKAPPADNGAHTAKLRAEIDNLADAIASGALRASPTLAARLTAAESELERLSTAPLAAPSPSGADLTQLFTDLPARAARAVDRLEETLATGDVARAREEIRAHVGTVTVEADEREVRLYSEAGVAAALARAAGGAHASLFGSGGVSWVSNAPEFVDVSLR